LKSLLYVAGDNVPSLDELRLAQPDILVIDFEESLQAPGRREQARAGLRAVTERLEEFPGEVAVRISSPAEDEGRKDLAALDALPARFAILVPKPVTAEHLACLRTTRRSLWVMGEEVEFAQRLPALHTQFPALELIVVGSKDLAESAGLPFDLDMPELRAAAEEIRAAAKARGLAVIDGVTFGAADKIKAARARAAREGYDGLSFIRLKDVACA
jgi:citrate lyase beta subunit